MNINEGKNCDAYKGNFESSVYIYCVQSYIEDEIKNNVYLLTFFYVIIYM
jgi:hypothetical protein